MNKKLLRATEFISGLPGIGHKSAVRIAVHLLKQNKNYLEQFFEALIDFTENTRFCPDCGAFTDIDTPCGFCTGKRNKKAMCVVEQPTDILSIENTNEFDGLYHALMGVLSPLDGVHPEDLRLQELKKRVDENGELTELIIATNPSVEGNATAHYITELLSDHNDLKITRIATGLAMGSQIEYTDSKVISQSIKDRVDLKKDW